MAKLALVCSSGGHIFQLFALQNVWRKRKHFWVSFLTPDAEFLLKDKNVYWAYFPTNRNIKNLLRNTVLAFRLIKKERPDIIISTGAGVAVPFIIIAKLFNIHSIYIESITRSKSLSLTGYLVYPFVDFFLAQWPELAERYRKVKYKGNIL